MILAIHHEVQSAVDYISEVAARQGTELGKGSALMGIERLRLKLPFFIAVEQREGKVEERPEVLTPAEIRRNLAQRKGFVIDRGGPGKRGLYTKIKVVHRPETYRPEGEGEQEQGKWQAGEIELVFSPLKRE
ncbi:hypothetical protein [Thermodesulfitimonas autotrophica]|uniref:hypothetical protein n=1 Tax=Thermodesulfitimonas autotrophica TaxID=1894989 RepID=UPI002FE2DD91